MSFIETNDHSWSADLWPPHLRFSSALGIPDHSDHAADWMVVPSNCAAMYDWAFVSKNTASRESSREQVLLYKSPPRVAVNTTLFPVAVRVQGFISRCNLRPLGNWNGDASTAISATQSVVIECRGNFVPWEATLSALRNIEDLVQESLKAYGLTELFLDRSGRAGQFQDLYCARRVFQKVTPQTAAALSALEEGDDPLNQCSAIAREWRVMKKLSSGRLLKDIEGNDYFEAYNARAFTPGDFVDLCIGFEIVSLRPSRRSSDARFKFRPVIQHIVLLRSAPSEGVTQIPF
ncbi:hypothetical protein DFH09DRAFT_1127252 [Mycena vulgaris]|nr:hypothetical protein DFH09DRAFT_1127252 [Mycena vulgaris]